MAHRTAMHTRSVGPRRESLFEKRRLAKAKTHSLCLTGYRSTALAPAEVAYVCAVKKVLFQSGNASTAGEVRAFLANEKPLPLRPPQVIRNLRAF